MGLDAVELLIALERSLAISIPDEAAGRVQTVRQLIDLCHSLLRPDARAGCVSQRAFHRLREAVSCFTGVPSRRVGVQTPLRSVLAGADPELTWTSVGEALGARSWPPLESRSWLRGFRPESVATFGEAARRLMAFDAHVLKAVGEGWAWSEVRQVVAGLLDLQLGIRSFALPDHLVRDLGIE